ncbi:hypothetical protein CTheo_8888 [Ceratobasidium theobromae]|uniref:Uncharacterized protein n=1 Tax=Ceratobasidium theobromae TaxID=1582974 RepID=A0A5N5Q857_9AGAM|nr:hypothetical protein CTheo_8888 [Ceratobasidium theobromae]
MHSLQQAHYSNFVHTYYFQGSPALVTAHRHWCSLKGFGVDSPSEDSCEGLSVLEEKAPYSKEVVAETDIMANMIRATVCIHPSKAPASGQDLPPLPAIPSYCQLDPFKSGFDLSYSQGQEQTNSPAPISPSDTGATSASAPASPITHDIQDIIEPLQQLNLSTEPVLPHTSTPQLSTQDTDAELLNWWRFPSLPNWSPTIPLTLVPVPLESFQPVTEKFTILSEQGQQILAKASTLSEDNPRYHELLNMIYLPLFERA